MLNNISSENFYSNRTFLLCFGFLERQKFYCGTNYTLLHVGLLCFSGIFSPQSNQFTFSLNTATIRNQNVRFINTKIYRYNIIVCESD